MAGGAGKLPRFGTRARGAALISEPSPIPRPRARQPRRSPQRRRCASSALRQRHTSVPCRALQRLHRLLGPAAPCWACLAGARAARVSPGQAISSTRCYISFHFNLVCGLRTRRRRCRARGWCGLGGVGRARRPGHDSCVEGAGRGEEKRWAE